MTATQPPPGVSPEFLQQVTRELTDKGKLIEAGWIGLRLAAIPADAGALQLDEARTAFFAGAHHLFASVMSILDPGDEPTEADMNRLELIDAELREFITEFEKRIVTKGSA